MQTDIRPGPKLSAFAVTQALSLSSSRASADLYGVFFGRDFKHRGF